MESPVFGKQDEQTAPHLTLTTEIFLIPLKLSFYPFYNKKQSAF